MSEDNDDDYFDDDYYDNDLPEYCPICCGEGCLPANEAYNDPINYGEELVKCPSCRGSGDRADCTYF